MARIKRFAIGALCIVVISVAPPSYAAKTCWDHNDAERSLARKINRARVNNGENGLALDKHLSRVSRYHTREMIERKTLYHTPLTKLGRRVTNWVVLAENIGRAASTRRVFKLMMSSSFHRANILKGVLTYMGIGVIRKGGNAWVTITLEARDNPGTRLSMPKC